MNGVKRRVVVLMVLILATADGGCKRNREFNEERSSIGNVSIR